MFPRIFLAVSSFPLVVPHFPSFFSHFSRIFSPEEFLGDRGRRAQEQRRGEVAEVCVLSPVSAPEGGERAPFCPTFSRIFPSEESAGSSAGAELAEVCELSPLAAPQGPRRKQWALAPFAKWTT